MKHHTLMIAFVLGTAVRPQSGGLTDPELDAAITAAKQQEFRSLFVEAHGRFGADFSVLLQGPVGRTMDLAREAFESYKPLDASSVPDQVRAHEVTFTVVRHSDTHQSIKNVVVMPPASSSRDAAIQPLSARWRHDNSPRTWKPRGAEPSGLPIFYGFAEDALATGDIQIIIATDSGDERYTVRAQERDRMR
jgi:hypothetical protein